MSNFVAGLTNVNPEITAPIYKQYSPYVQYNGVFPVDAIGSVSFPPSGDMFRYVIIQQQFTANQAICMMEVKVFLRGKPTLLLLHQTKYNIAVILRLMSVCATQKCK